MQLRTLYGRYPVVPGSVSGSPVAVERDGRDRYALVRDEGGRYWVRCRTGDGSPGKARLNLRGVAYVAGPMRGFPAYNFPAFDEAARRLIGAGFYVFNPADLDRMEGVTEQTQTVTEEMFRGCMNRDMNAICRCTHIALLPGWEKSSGVRPEAVLSKTLGLSFLDAVTLEPMDGGAVCAVIGARMAGEYKAWADSRQTAAPVN